MTGICLVHSLVSGDFKIVSFFCLHFFYIAYAQFTPLKVVKKESKAINNWELSNLIANVKAITHPVLFSHSQPGDLFSAMPNSNAAMQLANTEPINCLCHPSTLLQVLNCGKFNVAHIAILADNADFLNKLLELIEMKKIMKAHYTPHYEPLPYKPENTLDICETVGTC